MSEYAQYYEAFCLGRWARENEEECPCHGGGWTLSDVDTWHKCPIHWRKEMLHPDDGDQQADEEAWAKANPAEYALMLAEAEAERVRRAEETERIRQCLELTEDDIPF